MCFFLIVKKKLDIEVLKYVFKFNTLCFVNENIHILYALCNRNVSHFSLDSSDDHDHGDHGRVHHSNIHILHVPHQVILQSSSYF